MLSQRVSNSFVGWEIAYALPNQALILCVFPEQSTWLQKILDPFFNDDTTKSCVYDVEIVDSFFKVHS